MGMLHSRLSGQLSNLRKQTRFNNHELQQWYQMFIAQNPQGLLDRKQFSTIYIQVFSGGDPRDFANFLFDVFDENKNGYIDFREFVCALSTTMRGSLEEKLRWMFQLFDINNDGVITYNEMLSIMKASSKMTAKPLGDAGTPEERVNMVFRSLNKNKDSDITLSEFLHCAKQDPIVRKALVFLDDLE